MKLIKHLFLAAMLVLPTSSLALATVVYLGGPYAGMSKDGVRQLGIYHAILSQRAPGLLRPLIADAPYLDAPAACDSGNVARTHAILVGTRDTGSKWILPSAGPANDLAILSTLLADIGVDPARIHILQGEQSNRGAVRKAFDAVLTDIRCEDRVLIHFSAPSLPNVDILESVILRAADIVQTTDRAELNKRLVATSIERFARYKFRPDSKADTIALARIAGMKLATSDDLAILLEDASAEFHEIILGSDISDFMVAVRNRGAHALTVLDVMYAARADIETRQEAAGVDRLWRFEVGRSQTQWDPWARPTLKPGHGEFAVFYASASTEGAPHLRLPEGEPDAKVYGLFSYVIGSAIAENKLASSRTIASSVDEFYSATGRQKYHPRIETSDPDMVLIAELAPKRPERIRIISPAEKRGAAAIMKAEIEIEGVVEGDAKPISITVADADATLEAGGRFRHTVTLTSGLNKIKIRAITEDDRKHYKELKLTFNGDIKALQGEGRRYAVVIANQTYGNASGLPNLSTPFADAEALAAILTRRYGFETRLVLPDDRIVSLMLKDPSRDEITRVLHEVGKAVGSKDSVLIFYAGHGVFEPVTSIAYWVPHGAEAGYEPGFLSAADISAAVQRMQANKVILISDSCFSGVLTRSGQGPSTEPIAENQRIDTMLKLQSPRSRIIITSGNNEPVSDGGGDGHSVFARALLTGLERMGHDAFSARELFDSYILQPVMAKSDQEPQYRELSKIGHDGGDFVFVAIENTAPAAAAGAN